MEPGSLKMVLNKQEIQRSYNIKVNCAMESVLKYGLMEVITRVSGTEIARQARDEWSMETRAMYTQVDG
jgi:hypothetical protein